MKNITFFFIFLLLISAQPSPAIREGTANAAIFIKQYEQRGEWDKVALWHEAAAECLTRISIPMNEIAHAYYTRRGHEKWAARAKKERAEIQAQRQSLMNRAENAWGKSGVMAAERRDANSLSRLQAEREKIAQFIATWAPHYPDRFYDFGIYPTFFRAQRERAAQKKDYVKVLQLEADAAEMCAAQYEQIPIALGMKRYEKVRDAYRQHAMLLRALAKQNPKLTATCLKNGEERAINPLTTVGRGPVPRQAYDEERTLSNRAKTEVLTTVGRGPVPRQAYDEERSLSNRAKTDVMFQTAKSDSRVQKALENKNGIREYVWFQGFAWTVSFYNHSRGNLAIAIIDDKTGKVADVLIPGDSLEN